MSEPRSEHALPTDRLWEWCQETLAKGQGGRVIALIQAVDDWMQVCHQQETEIERLHLLTEGDPTSIYAEAAALRADNERLRGSLEGLAALADALFPAAESGSNQQVDP